MAATGKSRDSNGVLTPEPQTLYFDSPSALPALRPTRSTLDQQGILPNTLPKLVTDPWPVNILQDTTLPSCRHGRPYGRCFECYFEPAALKPPAPAASFCTPPDPMWTPTLHFPLQSSLPFSQAPALPPLFSLPASRMPAPPPLFPPNLPFSQAPALPPLVSLPASRMPILPPLFPPSLPSSQKLAAMPEKDPRVPRYHCQHILSAKRDLVYPTNKQGEQYGTPPAKVRKREKNSKFTKCRTAPPAIVHYTENPPSGKTSNRPPNLETPSHSTQKSCSKTPTSTEDQDALKQPLPQSQAKTPAKVGKPRVPKKVVKKANENNPAVTAELRLSCFSFCIELRVYEVDIVFVCLFFFLLSCFWEMDKHDLGL